MRKPVLASRTVARLVASTRSGRRVGAVDNLLSQIRDGTYTARIVTLHLSQNRARSHERFRTHKFSHLAGLVFRARPQLLVPAFPAVVVVVVWRLVWPGEGKSAMASSTNYIRLETHYAGGFIFLSYVVSVVGAWTTLELLLKRTGGSGWYNILLLVGAGVAFGSTATFGMHFVSSRPQCFAVSSSPRGDNRLPTS